MLSKNDIAFLVVGALGVISMLRRDTPKGIRNNNPLNIRHNDSNEWTGQIGVDSDGFVIFDSPENGYRAATKILLSYGNRGLNTLEQIIGTWAPPSENDTDSYIHSVALKVGIRRDDVINSDYYPQLLEAMTFHENGVFPYSQETIINGIARV